MQNGFSDLSFMYILYQKIVKEMNRLGIIIDLGQMEKSAQLSVISESQAPVVISKVGVSDSAAVNGNIDDLVLRKLVSITSYILPNTNF